TILKKPAARDLCYRIPSPVLEFLLLAGIPAGDVLQVPGDPADLGDIVGAALGADRLAAERAVFDPRDHFMGAVAVVERAHQFEVGLAAVRTRVLLNNEVAGVALVFTFVFRDIG